MMGIVTLVADILKGGLFFLFIAFVLGLIGWLLKKVGLFKLFKRRTKVPEKIYIEVAQHLLESGSFDTLAEKFSKFDKKIQDLYIKAYLEIKRVKNEKKD